MKSGNALPTPFRNALQNAGKNAVVNVSRTRTRNQSQNPFLYVAFRCWSIAFATQPQTARANLGGASRRELNDNPDHRVPPSTKGERPWR